MSSTSKKSLIERLRRGKETRARLVESNLAETIAFQMRATRNARGMTQEDLAEVAGMSQNNISRMESEEYGKYTIASLKRIAEAFDVALEVRFVPYSQYIDWLSATPHLDKGISPEALAVAGYVDEELAGRYDTEFRFFEIRATPMVSISTLNSITPVSIQAPLLTLHASGYDGAKGQVA